MAEVQVRTRDIESLAEKLAELQPRLTKPEQALLLFMLGVAADCIGRAEAEGCDSTLVSAAQDQGVPVVVAMSGSVPSIEDEFARAFTPRSAEGVRLLPGSIGPGPVD
jgi:ribosomal protein S12 methylthiotransferase accessory factor YcaO